MGNVFGHKKKDSGHSNGAAAATSAPPAHPNATITSQDQAILQLKVQKDRLHKYSKKIEIVINREVELAKELLRQEKKQNALLALKRKKYQETLLERTAAQMLNLEELVHSIQFASMQSQVFEALKQGNVVLERLNAQTNLEEVEALMADSQEAVDYQHQVSQMLGAELTEADTEDIEKTIAAWEAEELASDVSQLPEANNNITASDASTVTAPKKPVATKVKEKEMVLS